jgi:hypothetical protein
MKAFWVFVSILWGGMQILLATGGGSAPEVKVIHAEGKIFYHETFISWSTEYERYACDFLIEASENGRDWRIRGRVKSKGGPDHHAEYNFVDVREDRYKHYRIRKADSKGAMETLSQFDLENYSINVSLDEVVIDKEKKLLIEYRVDQNQELIVRIYNRIGEQVLTKVLPFSDAGEYIYQLDISHLQRDNYLLVVTQALLDKSVAEKAFQVTK